MSEAPATGAAAPSDDPAVALEAGLAAFAAGDLEAAHAAFERAHRRDPRAPRPMSWYGLTLVLVERNSSLGVSLCDQAVRALGPLPEPALNLARVHLALRQRERAVRAIGRALDASPRDPSLLAAREAMGMRRPPVIPFLPRSNPLNHLLGRLRHRWLQRRAGGPPAPASLGALPAPSAPARPATPRGS